MSQNADLKVSIIRESEQPTDEAFPHISKVLIAKLAEIFPDRCPDLNQSEREIFYKVGQVSVVTYLRIEHERQKEERR
jgi:hypothetical protein